MMLALGRHLADSTVFALVVWLVCLCMKRHGPAARHALWLLAVAKFAAPTVVFLRIGEGLGRLFPVGRASVVLSATFSDWLTSPVISASPKETMGWSGLPIAIWGIGTTVAFTLWLYKLWARRVSADSGDDSGQQWFRRLTERMGLLGRVRLMVSDAVREPALAGFRKHVVMIPATLVRQLSAAELESVALHELAHAKRRDNWTAAFAHAVTCVFWFYPLLWWLEKRLHSERELACDEIVIRCGATAGDYFTGILKVCRFHLAHEIAGMAGVSGSNLKKRKEAIMSVCPDTPTRRLPKTLIASLLAAVVAVPLAIGLSSASNARAADGKFAGEPGASEGTLFNMARQADAPARFVEATFGIKSLLVAAKLKNVASRPITQYRIGWIVVYRDGKTEISLAPVMNIPTGIAPGAVAQVPDQGVSPKPLDKRPRQIMFFLDEAKFSSGDVWTADTRSISMETTRNETRPAGSKSKTENLITCTSASVKVS